MAATFRDLSLPRVLALLELAAPGYVLASELLVEAGAPAGCVEALDGLHDVDDGRQVRGVRASALVRAIAFDFGSTGRAAADRDAVVALVRAYHDGRT